MKKTAVTIRPLQTVAEYRACEALQNHVWAMPDDLEVVPMHLLVTVQRNGGLLLGAFEDAELVGFVFGFPALGENGKPKHYSHMMGVAPTCQDKGIGFRLKAAQRESVLAQGLDLVAWTYDPLESRNARLNIHKLGSVCRTYVRDYYGPLADGLNAGLPSDRFQVEWWIASERVCQRLAGTSIRTAPNPIPLVNTTGCTREGLVTPGALVLDIDAPVVQVQIPADYQAIKASDAGLALEWRLAMREAFEVYFARGYTVVDFVCPQIDGSRSGYYILQAD
jgi:chorismate synthase